MKKELYLFIIWPNAHFMEKYIINDIKKKFELFKTYQIEWSPELYSFNLARFYGKKLPKGCKKEKEIGVGTFTVLLVYDRNPQYVDGKNIAVLTAKSNYRQAIGKNLIHASDCVAETNENLLFLLGKNISDIEQEESQTVPQTYHGDLIGANDWNSIEEALNIVKKVPFTRVSAYKDSFFIHSRHADLVKRLLNASSNFKFPGRHKYFITVGNRKQPIYLRKVD